MERLPPATDWAIPATAGPEGVGPEGVGLERAGELAVEVSVEGEAAVEGVVSVEAGS